MRITRLPLFRPFPLNSKRRFTSDKVSISILHTVKSGSMISLEKPIKLSMIVI